MKRKIDLFKAMQTFLSVAEHGSFSAAARQLGLVVSAVSRQVADLERYYDTRLIQRTTRVMSLTAEGESYRTQFQEIVARLDNLASASQERRQRIAGHLRVTAPHGFAPAVLQQTINTFLQCHSQVSLSWLLVNRFVNLVEEGIDLAIRIGQLPDSSLVARPYAQMRVLFVASPEYLAQHGTPAHPRQLSTHRCVLDSSNLQPGRWDYVADGRQRQVGVSGRVDANRGELVAQLAAMGHGIARLPQFLVAEYLARGELTPLLTRYESAPMPVSLVYPSNRMSNPPLQLLVEQLLAKASESID